MTMTTTEHRIAIRDIAVGYSDRNDAGVTAYGGRLDARPAYQREFIYAEQQQQAVIDTVLKGAPLSLVYWATRQAGASNPAEYEILDGQQRTLSLMRFVNGAFKIDFQGTEQYFHNLPSDVQDQILDYKLIIYICDGTDSEKLDWFSTINIAGEVLNTQELLNAVFSGPWLVHAKQYFSKQGSVAASMSDGYARGAANRQDYLALALKWIVYVQDEGSDIDSAEGYMAAHAHDANANELRNHFSNVISWAQSTFPNKRKELASVDWGRLYQAYGDRSDLDAGILETRVAALMADPDVSKKSGVYEYVLSGRERLLSIRAFTQRDKRTAYEQQEHKCAGCLKEFAITELQGDHIVPWSQGGATVPENLEMLCEKCHEGKSRRQSRLVAQSVGAESDG